MRISIPATVLFPVLHVCIHGECELVECQSLYIHAHEKKTVPGCAQHVACTVFPTDTTIDVPSDLRGFSDLLAICVRDPLVHICIHLRTWSRSVVLAASMLIVRGDTPSEAIRRIGVTVSPRQMMFLTDIANSMDVHHTNRLLNRETVSLRGHQKTIFTSLWSMWSSRPTEGCIIRVDTGLGKTIVSLYTIYRMILSRQHHRYVDPVDGSMITKHADGRVDVRVVHPLGGGNRMPNIQHTPRTTFFHETTLSSRMFRVLVIVPTSILNQWHSEYLHVMHYPPELVQVVSQSNHVFDPTIPLVLTTIEKLRSEIKKGRVLLEQRWDVVVIDEIHRFGNMLEREAHTTIPIYKTVFDLLDRQFTIGLTATPYGTGLQNITSSLKILRVSTTLDATSDAQLPGAPQQRSLGLESVFRTYAIDVQGDSDVRLPPLTQRTKVLDVGSRERGILKGLYGTFVNCIKGARRGATPEIRHQNRLKLMGIQTRMRVYTNSGMTMREDQGIKQLLLYPKVQFVLEYCRHLLERSGTDRKLVVASDLVHSLDCLHRALHASLGVKVRIFEYNGTIPSASRNVVQAEFNAYDGFCVLLLSKGTGAVGLNLVAGHLVVYEPAFAMRTDVQTVGRVRRMGQTHPVCVTFLLITDSIDTRIQRSQCRQFEQTRHYAPRTIELDLVRGVDTTSAATFAEGDESVHESPPPADEGHEDEDQSPTTPDGGTAEELVVLVSVAETIGHVDGEDVPLVVIPLETIKKVTVSVRRRAPTVPARIYAPAREYTGAQSSMKTYTNAPSDSIRVSPPSSTLTQKQILDNRLNAKKRKDFLKKLTRK